MESKRLYRSLYDRKFAGVAGGLAEYFVMDPLLIRLAFVILTLAGGGGFLIYLVLWIVTPENPAKANPFVNQQAQDFQPSNAGAPDYTDTSQATTAGTPKSETTYSATSPPPEIKTQKRGSFIGGMVLITLGVLFLADEFIPQVNFGDLWPVILIVVGAGLLLNAVTKRNRNTNQY